jgi:hypothetical protein
MKRTHPLALFAAMTTALVLVAILLPAVAAVGPAHPRVRDWPTMRMGGPMWDWLNRDIVYKEPPPKHLHIIGSDGEPIRIPADSPLLRRKTPRRGGYRQ